MTFLDQKRTDDANVDRRAGGTSQEALGGWTVRPARSPRELGGITRNAVIGKVHRLGLLRPRQGALLLGAASSASRARPVSDVPHRQRPVVRGNTALAAVRSTTTTSRPSSRSSRTSSRSASAARCSNSTSTSVTGRSAIRASRISISAAARPAPARPTAAITAASPTSRRRHAAIGVRTARESALPLVLPCVTNSGGAQAPPVLFNGDTLRGVPEIIGRQVQNASPHHRHHRALIAKLRICRSATERHFLDRRLLLAAPGRNHD